MPQPSAPLAIVLDNLSHLYGRTPVLRRITGSFAGGRCYLLLGPNGAGKSTLLRILAGLLRPTFGTVTVLGHGPFEQRARIGYMGHAPMLFEEYTAQENLRYFAALYRGRPCLAEDEALAAVGLAPTIDRPLSAYSQGMRQRVSLARVLLPRPELLLLDEPFSNVDAASAAAMLALLATLRAGGCTIVMTTHQRALAQPLADELLLLEDGALERETA